MNFSTNITYYDFLEKLYIESPIEIISTHTQNESWFLNARLQQLSYLTDGPKDWYVTTLRAQYECRVCVCVCEGVGGLMSQPVVLFWHWLNQKVKVDQSGDPSCDL